MRMPCPVTLGGGAADTKFVRSPGEWATRRLPLGLDERAGPFSGFQRGCTIVHIRKRPAFAELIHAKTSCRTLLSRSERCSDVAVRSHVVYAVANRLGLMQANNETPVAFLRNDGGVQG
jgi:hypothetical protein